MSIKSQLKTLSTANQTIVSTPSAIESITLCNRSNQTVSVTILLRRNSEDFVLFKDDLISKKITTLFGDKIRGVNIEAEDILLASCSAADSVDLSCAYKETTGSSPLFNSTSWKDRASWATARGTTTGSFNPPQFVLNGLNAGAYRWRRSSCYKSDVFSAIQGLVPGWSGLELEGYSEINANNGYLAACGVNLYVSGDSILNSVSFDLQVNLYYANQLTQAEWDDILTHEMGHALGIGIFWTASSFFLSGSSYSSIQSSYNLITSLSRVKTPLESSGGTGTASAHWENNFRLSDGVDYYGVIDELMVGALVSDGMFLSELSLGALKDFGYETHPAVERKPKLATSSSFRAQENVLKCGLCSISPENMTKMMSLNVLATDGKFHLHKYIIT